MSAGLRHSFDCECNLSFVSWQKKNIHHCILKIVKYSTSNKLVLCFLQHTLVGDFQKKSKSLL